MNKRSDWGFVYTREEVAEGCRAKLHHHKHRLAFWAEQLAHAEQDLRQKGIELREHQITGGARLQAVLDPERAARLEECQSKVREHTRQCETYHAFLTGIEHMADGASLSLGADDIVFFGLMSDDYGPGGAG